MEYDSELNLLFYDFLAAVNQGKVPTKVLQAMSKQAAAQYHNADMIKQALELFRSSGTPRVSKSLLGIPRKPLH